MYQSKTILTSKIQKSTNILRSSYEVGMQFTFFDSASALRVDSNAYSKDDRQQAPQQLHLCQHARDNSPRWYKYLLLLK